MGAGGVRAVSSATGTIRDLSTRALEVAGLGERVRIGRSGPSQSL